MTELKTRAWLTGKSANEVIRWYSLNYINVIATVKAEAPAVSEEFVEKLKPYDFIDSNAQLDLHTLELTLAQVFGLLPVALTKKLEMRFRSYYNRKIKREKNWFGKSIEEAPANSNTWVTQAQLSTTLSYLYYRMDSVKERSGLFRDPDDVYSYVTEIYRLHSSLQETDKEDVLNALNAILQKYFTLKGWRELKHTIRSFKHIKEKKLVSIKIDSSAKKKLEHYKAKLDLNSISEVIHALCDKLK